MEPIAKRSKLDDGVFVLDRLKGRIVFRIDGISELIKPTRGCLKKSECIRIRGFDFRLSAGPVYWPSNGLDFSIKYNDGSRGLDWNCAVSVILLGTSDSEEFEMGRLDNKKFDATANVAQICTVSV